MRTKNIAVFAVALSTFAAIGQTNRLVEYRIVHNVTYDVGKPPFITVKIPAGVALANEQTLNYKGPASPAVNLQLQIPAIYSGQSPVIMSIADFPYSPAYFQQGFRQTGMHSERVPITGLSSGTMLQPTIESCLVTKAPIILRLFPLSHPQTNYTATGVMTIIPAQPIFDYGLPVTNSPAQ